MKDTVKDKILNALMLFTVAAALILTLIRGQPETQPSPSQVFAALATGAPTASPHPIDAYRARRAESRRQERSALLALAESEFSSPESRALAQEQLRETAAREEIELAVEAALAAQGFDRALCVARGGSVTILLSREATAPEAALILEIAREASGLSPENIRIAAC